MQFILHYKHFFPVEHDLYNMKGLDEDRIHCQSPTNLILIICYPLTTMQTVQIRNEYWHVALYDHKKIPDVDNKINSMMYLILMKEGCSISMSTEYKGNSEKTLTKSNEPEVKSLNRASFKRGEIWKQIILIILDAQHS